jgi:Polyketide cyclase / dehydrase and lipid transport
MGPVSVSTPIDVPRERAFDFVADLANRPAFMGSFLTEYRLQRLDSTGVGASARFRVRERGLWMETVIEELDRPHLILERGSGSRLGRMPVSTAWELTEAGFDGCEVRLSHWTEPSHPGDWIAEKVPGIERFYRRALTASLAQLKAMLEAGTEPGRVGVAGGDLVPGAG